MVCVIVTSGMNHQRATFQACYFKSGSQYRIICITHGIYEQRRQVTEMAFTPWQSVALTCGWVIMPSSSQCRHNLPVLLFGLATRVFVHMETM